MFGFASASAGGCACSPSGRLGLDELEQEEFAQLQFWALRSGTDGEHGLHGATTGTVPADEALAWVIDF